MLTTAEKASAPSLRAACACRLPDVKTELRVRVADTAISGHALLKHTESTVLLVEWARHDHVADRQLVDGCL